MMHLETILYSLFLEANVMGSALFVRHIQILNLDVKVLTDKITFSHGHVFINVYFGKLKLFCISRKWPKEGCKYVKLHIFSRQGNAVLTLTFPSMIGLRVSLPHIKVTYNTKVLLSFK